MRIAIFGLTISSSWANGHATLWRGLCRALARKQHQVSFFEKDVSFYASHRDLTFTEGYDLSLYPAWEQIAAQAQRSLRECDAAIVTSYCPDAKAACDLVLQSNVPVKIFYDLDTPVTMEHVRAQEEVAYLPSYGLEPFDLVLSYTGGRALEELRTWLGARQVAPLYGSVDTEFYRPVSASDCYRADLSYLGTYAADRQATLDRLFLQPARELPKKKFLIGGAQYPDDFPWVENVYFVRHVPPAQHPAFYCSSTATLSVTRGAMAEMGYCPSGRLFEAAACTAPILTDNWEGLDEFFEPGREILVASQPEDIAEALMLPEEELRKAGTAARERVLAEHTADHRAQQMIEMIEAAA